MIFLIWRICLWCMRSFRKPNQALHLKLAQNLYFVHSSDSGDIRKWKELTPRQQETWLWVAVTAIQDLSDKSYNELRKAGAASVIGVYE